MLSFEVTCNTVVGCFTSSFEVTCHPEVGSIMLSFEVTYHPAIGGSTPSSGLHFVIIYGLKLIMHVVQSNLLSSSRPLSVQ